MCSGQPTIGVVTLRLMFRHTADDIVKRWCDMKAGVSLGGDGLTALDAAKDCNAVVIVMKSGPGTYFLQDGPKIDGKLGKTGCNELGKRITDGSSAGSAGTDCKSTGAGTKWITLGGKEPFQATCSGVFLSKSRCVYKL